MNVKTLQCMQIERHPERTVIMKQCEESGIPTIFCEKRNSALEIGWDLKNGRSGFWHFVLSLARPYVLKLVKNPSNREQLWTTNQNSCETTKYKGISYALKIYCARGIRHIRLFKFKN